MLESKQPVSKKQESLKSQPNIKKNKKPRNNENFVTLGDYMKDIPKIQEILSKFRKPKPYHRNSN